MAGIEGKNKRKYLNVEDYQQKYIWHIDLKTILTNINKKPRDLKQNL